ncbi:MAG: WecB/TagA/CpsF family glycosyltransferase, partial [Amphiplicatus sp.]
DRRVWSVLGIPVDMADIAGAASAVAAAARDGRRLSFVTPNLNWLARALRDPEARRQIIDADLSLADGAPVVAIARALGAPISGRAAGSDVFEALRARPGFHGRRLRVFFFGGRDGAAEAAAAALSADKGGFEPAGFLNPGHGDVASMSDEATLATINAANADFLVVALGAAKGQDWIDRNQGGLNAPVIAHLGAVVDFTGGSIRRAPAIWRRLGLEWAWRIREEPALWRRYRADAAAFLTVGLPRLLPQIFAARRAKTPAGAALENRADAVVVRLSGDLFEPGLEPVRQAFRATAASGRAIRLNFAAVNHFDGAFLGLVLMLEKHAGRRGVALATEALTAAQAKMLARNAMAYQQEAAETDAALAMEAS